MKQSQINWLKENFSETSEFFVDGYYRFRQSDEASYEVAFLVPCACGSNNVHPQITLENHGSEYIATKLIDMDVTPPIVLTRNAQTSEQIDQTLSELMTKFETAKK
ncbi:hypothetical protein [Vagococcus xieshaowenii]|uniref:Uncharacterized protein n=1 Tax=Vagococcus xieshaowenii TaxID=2562451 RepID=A0AAJ5JQH0_9ENTE|nr:hypothetical protein [Vagococcus xieshaowenii]QCA29126.1 hypothetical protein E4Z98_07295 [Vagococcus xieshaowenii]TFZ40897.1 hypothetical protein E4031_05800 [Vagococcus xieshaowenii]